MSEEFTVYIEDEKYLDSLILSLVHQGFNVYMSYDSLGNSGEKKLCFNFDPLDCVTDFNKKYKKVGEK